MAALYHSFTSSDQNWEIPPSNKGLNTVTGACPAVRGLFGVSRKSLTSVKYRKQTIWKICLGEQWAPTHPEEERKREIHTDASDVTQIPKQH